MRFAGLPPDDGAITGMITLTESYDPVGSGTASTDTFDLDVVGTVSAESIEVIIGGGLAAFTMERERG